MLIGYSGNHRKGYEIKQLITKITDIIDTPEGINVAIIGMGNLGKALINHLKGKRDKIQIVACFDIMPEKIRKQQNEVKCYHIDDLEKVVQKENIKIALLTLPGSETISVAKRLVLSGIKGILNFTSTPLNLPNYVYVEKYDIVTALEKVAYFAKHNDINEMK